MVQTVLILFLARSHLLEVAAVAVMGLQQTAKTVGQEVVVLSQHQ
jgi:hypothetical protein